MSNSNMVVMPQGCTLTKFGSSQINNIVLSLPSTDAYEKTGNPAFFGETIGRVANRISDARICNLNGQSYTLTANDDNGQTCLHGGTIGWGKQMWHRAPTDETRVDSLGRMRSDVQKFTYLSKDGDQGFPANVEARAWWFYYQEDDRTIIEVEYEAQMTSEQPNTVHETVVSITNHSYFNLTLTVSNHVPSISGTIVTLPTTKHLQLRTEDQIPTGEIVALEESSSIQANTPFLLGDSGPRLDHCFVLNDDPATVPLDSRAEQLRRCISLAHPHTGINVEVWSSEPAFQVYTGDYIDVQYEGMHFGSRSGIAVEPGRYTNATNHDRWQQMVRLRKDAKWGSRIRYVLWVEAVSGDK